MKLKMVLVLLVFFIPLVNPLGSQKLYAPVSPITITLHSDKKNFKIGDELILTSKVTSKKDFDSVNFFFSSSEYF